MQEHKRSRAELTSMRGVRLRKVKLETRGERGTFQISLMSSGFLFYSVIFSKSIEKHSVLKTTPTLHPPVEVLVNLFTTTEQKRWCDRSGFVFNLVVCFYSGAAKSPLEFFTQQQIANISSSPTSCCWPKTNIIVYLLSRFFPVLRHYNQCRY